MNKISKTNIGLLMIGFIISSSIFFASAEEDKEFEDSILLTIDNDYEFKIFSFAINFGNQIELEWRSNDTTWGWISAGGDVSKEVAQDTEGRLTLTATDNGGLIFVQVLNTPVDNTTVILLKYAYNWNGDARLPDDSIFSDTNTDTVTMTQIDEEPEEGDPLVGLIFIVFIGIGVYYYRKRKKTKIGKVNKSKEYKILPKSVFCRSCGTSLTPGSEFCTNCGTKSE